MVLEKNGNKYSTFSRGEMAVCVSPKSKFPFRKLVRFDGLKFAFTAVVFTFEQVFCEGSSDPSSLSMVSPFQIRGFSVGERVTMKPWVPLSLFWMPSLPWGHLLSRLKNLFLSCSPKREDYGESPTVTSNWQSIERCLQKYRYSRRQSIYLNCRYSDNKSSQYQRNSAVD